MNTIISNPNVPMKGFSLSLLLSHFNINGQSAVAVGALSAVAAVAAGADSVNYIVESIRLPLYLFNFISNKPNVHMQSTLCSAFIAFNMLNNIRTHSAPHTGV